MTFLAIALTLAGCETSQIQPDESVLFFPAIGRLDADGANWTIPVHGWIFEREERSEARAVLIALVRAALGVAEPGDESETLKKRIQPFLWDSERRKRVSVHAGGKGFLLDESGPNGHFTGTLTLPADEARKLARNGGRLALRAVLAEGDARVFEGEARLLGEKGTSIISDIDDTIKVSEVLDKKALLRNTLLREFRAVPGMAEVYAAADRQGAAFHYVTGSPWQLYEALSEFLKAKGFPSGAFHMKLFRLKDSSFLDLFESPVDYKRGEIEPLLDAFPMRSFIFVGDSGQKDPEIYGAVARKFPEQVERILIRDVTGEDASSARMLKAFEGVPAEKWKVFREAQEISPLLKAPAAKRF